MRIIVLFVVFLTGCMVTKERIEYLPTVSLCFLSACTTQSRDQAGQGESDVSGGQSAQGAASSSTPTLEIPVADPELPVMGLPQ
jgi:hypothetical protein